MPAEDRPNYDQAASPKWPVKACIGVGLLQALFQFFQFTPAVWFVLNRGGDLDDPTDPLTI